jgi:hypothetical protein
MLSVHRSLRKKKKKKMMMMMMKKKKKKKKALYTTLVSGFTPLGDPRLHANPQHATFILASANVSAERPEEEGKSEQSSEALNRPHPHHATFVHMHLQMFL